MAVSEAWAISANVRTPHVNAAASLDAFICAIDSIEIMGFTPDAVGKHEPSATTRLRTSQVVPSGSVAEESGDPPIRALPM